jgi:hypothetical protein
MSIYNVINVIWEFLRLISTAIKFHRISPDANAKAEELLGSVSRGDR